ncbi:hypothetical protein [Virgibacillus sp. SK37]|uniref:hypothetical protein n=1 Tax=Virgibacillus sp. SK37 TaxID=403957 RepID=UPI0004D0F725|nr:hypothetical protein [Virgibacillus sp. SK37]AIF45665.1 hypothetical protein X953_18930 [Virgibacillus sp. SK37]
MAQLGNIQRRSKETKTERDWRLFGEELQRELGSGFHFDNGTSQKGDELDQHIFARNAKFDFVFYFGGWDTQTYKNIPAYHKGNFTGKQKDWMWDFNYQMNIEVKRVGLGTLPSVMPYRFMKAFGVPFSDRSKWLIVDFSNVLKIRNFGGFIYILEQGEGEPVHHIFGSHVVEDACIGEYKMDWEGDPTEAGGGGYKAKTLLDKTCSLKFNSFQEVKQYIRRVSEVKLEKEKNHNRFLFRKNIEKGKTDIIEYSDNKVGEVDPVLYDNGDLRPASKSHIECKQIIDKYEPNCYDYKGHIAYECETCMGDCL